MVYPFCVYLFTAVLNQYEIKKNHVRYIQDDKADSLIF